MKRKFKKGFTLIELLGVIFIIAIISICSVPIVIGIINFSKKSAFKSSAISVFDSVEYYVANNKFTSISEDGIDIKNTSGLNLKNNNFESGWIIKNSSNDFELLYLTEGLFCAMGTAENLKISDQGCGKLDTTVPDKAYLNQFKTTNDSITVLGIGYDNDSEIIKYEFSIDGKKFVSNENVQNSTYTFNDIAPGEHTFKLRITNEAGLTLDSEEYKYNTVNIENIYCSLDTFNIVASKNVTCHYPVGENYNYQYSLDNNEYQNIKLNEDTYTFTIDNNGTLYTRVLIDNRIVGYTSINMHNIDNTLNGATPVLSDSMIPIIYNENTKEWIKADPKTIYWDYSNKVWANAVVVREYEDLEDVNSKSRTYYLSDEAIGKPIYEKDILSYFVWIPRFEYKIWNVNGTDYKNIDSNGETLISINFQSKEKKSDGMTNDLISNGNFFTHPSFTIDSTELNGFWVAKFQSSVKEYTECYKIPNVTNCNKSSGLDIYSLPGVNPIRNISISSAFVLAKNMNISSNIYGFKSVDNSHIIKNTEWGAVAYLTHSNYGSDVSNNTTTLSGTNNYKENTNISTTNNIYGVYDTGSLYGEMVMGNYNSDPGTDFDNQSGFVGLNGSVEWPDSKYYDLYQGITSKSRILGDATGETEGWFETKNDFVNGTNPFFVRGGNTVSKNNVFNYTSYSGGFNENITFRTVIAKENISK